MKWIRCTRRQPCPICQKSDWCGISDDGHWAICMRTPSDRSTRNGGYMHRLTDAPPRPRPRPAPARPKPAVDFEARWRQWERQTPQSRMMQLADQLGVSLAALLLLGAAWAEPHQAWAFPMRNPDHRIVGIRLRAVTGRKWAVRGSREGLFVAITAPEQTCMICEGPTDTAAGITLGMPAIGRPSCLGAVELLRQLCRRRGIRQVVIIGDNDPPKARPGGYWQPGLDGARKLINALALPYKLILPPAKDLRAWVAQGAQRADFDHLLHMQRWRTP
jgi:hypothetical protein